MSKIQHTRKQAARH